MQDEVKLAIENYLKNLSIVNGHIDYRLKTDSNPWFLRIEYYQFDLFIKDNEYSITFLENGCEINTVPAWVPPIQHETVDSLMYYISRYNY